VTAPKLIGLVRLPFPRIKHRKGDPYTEMIGEIGVDVDGQAWGLVVRQTPIPEANGKIPTGPHWRRSRLSYERWVRYDAIAFAPDEVVTEKEWANAPPPPRPDYDE
jgi:hypothetical protein